MSEVKHEKFRDIIANMDAKSKESMQVVWEPEYQRCLLKNYARRLKEANETEEKVVLQYMLEMQRVKAVCAEKEAQIQSLRSALMSIALAEACVTSYAGLRHIAKVALDEMKS